MNLKKNYSFKDIDETINPDDVDLSSFELKNNLNPKFWHSNKLDLYARRNLLMIARDFINNLEMENIAVKDVVITGSIANYNWNEKYSDIDLHIIVDFDETSDDKDLVKKYFDAVKKSWNNRHEDLKIYGYGVEVYMQDESEKHIASGVYSILKDKWLEKPDINKLKNDNLDNEKIKVKSSDFMNRIDDLENELLDNEESGDYDILCDIYEKADKLLDEIKNERKESLAASGKEMSEGNIIFKSLRRFGYIEKIFNIKRKSYDLANSL